MIKVVAAICLIVLFIACEKEDDSFDCTVNLEIADHSPHSMVLSVEGFGIEVARLELVNKELDEVLAMAQLNEGSGKLLVNQLSPGSSFDYLVKIDGQVIESGHAELPLLPEAYNDFIDIQIDGIPDLKGGYLLMNKMSQPSGIFLLDDTGRVIWSRLSDNFVKMVKLTKRGTLLTLEDNLGDKFGNGNLIYETTFTGDTLVKLTHGVAGFDRMAHHDVVLTERGTYAFITNVLVDGLIVDGITELNAYGEKVWEWDMASQVLPVQSGEVFNQPWANSIEETKDGNFLVSFRALSQVWLINPADDKVLMKFGGDNNMGLPEQHLPLFQHHAQMVGEDEMLLFDNGGIDERAFSRVMRYSISDNYNLASLVNEIVLPQSLFSPYMSAVQEFNDGYLVTSSTKNQIAHVGLNNEVNWSMQLGDRMFRAQLVNMSFN